MSTIRAVHSIVEDGVVLSKLHISRYCLRKSAPSVLKYTQRAQMGYRNIHTVPKFGIGQCSVNFQQVRFNSTSPFNSQHPEYPGPGPSISSTERGRLRLEYLMVELEERPELKKDVYDFMELLLSIIQVHFRQNEESPLVSKMPVSAQHVIVLFRLMWNAEINAKWREVVQKMDNDHLPVYMSDLCLVGDYVLHMLS